MPALNYHKSRTYYHSEMSTRASSTSPGTSRKVAKSSASSSAPSSRPPVRSDPYYGHEDTAVLCSKFITSLFQCPNIPTAVAPGAPTPALAHFVAYALHRTRLPSIVTFAALLLLQRLKTRFPAARGSSGHRLFISAFMIASKIICDDTYSNQSWGIVAQKMFALKEINQMEREMCGYLEWNLNVGGLELESFEKKVRAEHGPRVPVVAVYPTEHRPIRPVPTFRRSAVVVPSPAPSPADYHLSPPSFASANSSLASSPASDDCKTPSPVALTRPAPVSRSSKVDYYGRHAQAQYPLTSAW